MDSELIKKNLLYFLSNPALQAGYVMTHTHVFGEEGVFVLNHDRKAERAIPNLLLLPVELEHLDKEYDKLTMDEQAYVRTFVENATEGLENVNGAGWYVGKNNKGMLEKDLADLEEALNEKQKPEEAKVVTEYRKYSTEVLQDETVMQELKTHQSLGTFEELKKRVSSVKLGN